MAKTYRPPEEALGPKDMVEIDRILIDGGPDDVSIAREAWDGDPCLLIRWNGSPEKPQGFPANFKTMLWYVVPEWMVSFVLDAVASKIGADILGDERCPKRLPQA